MRLGSPKSRAHIDKRPDAHKKETQALESFRIFGFYNSLLQNVQHPGSNVVTCANREAVVFVLQTTFA